MLKFGLIGQASKCCNGIWFLMHSLPLKLVKGNGPCLSEGYLFFRREVLGLLDHGFELINHVEPLSWSMVGTALATPSIS